MYLAHRAEDGREQSVLAHSQAVATLAAGFAAPFRAEKPAELAGLLHDIGKYSDAFQRRIRGENIQVDHSTAGAWECFQLRQAAAAFCVAGHHSGLPELGVRDDLPELPSLYGRMNRAKEGRLEPYDAWQGEITPPEVPPQTPADPLDSFFFTRMLYSCLVDADFLDTEWFMDGPVERGGGLGIPALEDRFWQYARKRWFPPKGELAQRRCAILKHCADQGKKRRPGLFTLTIPTGGGKTAASLAFALSHARAHGLRRLSWPAGTPEYLLSYARAHGLRRIVYVIPYTSIIEQTAAEFRRFLGAENVLEHHSGVTFDAGEKSELRPEEARLCRAAENWDMPVVVTTAVQFFESLYADRSSKCRKLHNLAGSVIIFDEAQMLPLPYLRPCVSAIAQLVKNFGASAVLCTATQPALGPIFQEFLPGVDAVELCPAELAAGDIFRRVTFRRGGQWSWDRLGETLNTYRQVLCVVNSRKAAQEVYDRLEDEGRFHLSTLMYPAHRRAVLEKIRERLKEGLPCRVVSTSLIEAGVDVDFPAVFREEAGLDSVIQAAGRCNREGKRSAQDSVVTVFRGEDPPSALFDKAIGAAREVMGLFDDWLSPQAIESYFEKLLDLSGQDAQDEKDILALIRQNGFPFRTVAERFHLIDQPTRTVYIPTAESQALLDRLERGEISKELFRELGQYGVSVYEGHFQDLLSAGARPLLSDGENAVLTDLTLYDAATGLASAVPDGRALMI